MKKENLKSLEINNKQAEQKNFDHTTESESTVPAKVVENSIDSEIEDFEDETTQTQNSSKQEQKKRRDILPSADWELLMLAQRVIENLKNYPELQLISKSREEFINDVKKFENALKAKYRCKDSRSPVISELTMLDEEIDNNLGKLKALLLLKYNKTKAVAMYAKFGIEKVYGKYGFKDDRGDRIRSLEKLVNALAEEGIEHNEYGLNYWTEIYEKYKSLLGENFIYTSDISEESAKLTVLRQDIRQYLRDLARLVKVQYKKDIASKILRDLGYFIEQY